MKRESTEHVSKCCGQKYTMEIIWSVILADSKIIPLQTPGRPPEETPVCCGCGEPCAIVMKGEETKPSEGGIYCPTCARRLAGRIPKGLVLKYPAPYKGKETVCWGCGRTVALREASELIKQ